MSHSTLIDAQLNAPLRALALTVEETGKGQFRWRILENPGQPEGCVSVLFSDTSFSAYDTALATGYGELQRLIGPDLQYGPRQDVDGDLEALRPVLSPAAKAPAVDNAHEARRLNGDGLKSQLRA